MNLKNFLMKMSKEQSVFVGHDAILKIMEIIVLIEKFEILYGVKIKLDFKPKEVKGKWLYISLADELLNIQKYVNTN